MPIIQPKDNEKQADYMGRCMEFMKEEKYPQKQKVAICLNTYSNPKSKKSKANEIEVDISENTAVTAPDLKNVYELDITQTEAYQKYKNKSSEFVEAIPESTKKEHKLS